MDAQYYDNFKSTKYLSHKYTITESTLRDWADSGHVRSFQFNGAYSEIVYNEFDVVGMIKKM